MVKFSRFDCQDSPCNGEADPCQLAIHFLLAIAELEPILIKPLALGCHQHENIIRVAQKRDCFNPSPYFSYLVT